MNLTAELRQKVINNAQSRAQGVVTQISSARAAFISNANISFDPQADAQWLQDTLKKSASEITSMISSQAIGSATTAVNTFVPSPDQLKNMAKSEAQKAIAKAKEIAKAKAEAKKKAALEKAKEMAIEKAANSQSGLAKTVASVAIVLNNIKKTTGDIINRAIEIKNKVDNAITTWTGQSKKFIVMKIDDAQQQISDLFRELNKKIAHWKKLADDWIDERKKKLADRMMKQAKIKLNQIKNSIG